MDFFGGTLVNFYSTVELWWSFIFFNAAHEQLKKLNFLNHSAYEPMLKEIGGQCLDLNLHHQPVQSRLLSEHSSQSSDGKVEIIFVIV